MKAHFAARKMDMLNGDLQLKNLVLAKRKGGKSDPEYKESEAAFHFIAFVPIDGNVWKLDGLERQPQQLYRIGCDDWIYQAKPDIQARMGQYEEGQIEFSILSLVKEPIGEIVATLAKNVKSIIAITIRLNDSRADWKDFIMKGEGFDEDFIIAGPDSAYGLSHEMIEQTKLPSPVEEALLTNVVSVLVELRQKLVAEQAGLRASIKDEQQCIQFDQERAASRRYDYGRVVQSLVHMLGRNLKLKQAMS